MNPSPTTGLVERLQQAWDSVDSLPPIIFTEAEATALCVALFQAIDDISYAGAEPVECIGSGGADWLNPKDGQL